MPQSLHPPPSARTGRSSGRPPRAAAVAAPSPAAPHSCPPQFHCSAWPDSPRTLAHRFRPAQAAAPLTRAECPCILHRAGGPPHCCLTACRIARSSRASGGSPSLRDLYNEEKNHSLQVFFFEDFYFNLLLFDTGTYLSKPIFESGSELITWIRCINSDPDFNPAKYYVPNQCCGIGKISISSSGQKLLNNIYIFFFSVVFFTSDLIKGTTLNLAAALQGGSGQQSCGLFLFFYFQFHCFKCLFKIQIKFLPKPVHFNRLRNTDMDGSVCAN